MGSDINFKEVSAEICAKINMNTDDTKSWIEFIEEVIERFELVTYVYADSSKIVVATAEEKEFIEKLMYEVEETETSLEYIFEGNVFKLYT